MVTLFKSNYEKNFKAPWLSCSAFTTLIIYFAAFVLPYIFVYSTNNMWTKQSVYWEQPDVLFRNVLFLEVLTEDG